MIKHLRQWITSSILLCVGAIAAHAATIGPTLSSTLNNVADSSTVGVVIVAFKTTSGLNASHLLALTSVGITSGIEFQQLGMVAAPATAGQVKALAGNSSVRSIWLNDQLNYFMNQARVLTGVDRLRNDPNFTRANGGFPVAGQGNFSVVINDSGIDGTHADVHYPDHVIQNVQILTDTVTLSGFTSLQTVAGVPDTDSHVGHGTHCSGILGGTGADSGGVYTGVAPGAKLIGLGSGAVLFILNGLGGFEWSLSNQFVYNIRVISNSWGSSGEFNPDDPISIATKACHDRNIVVCFAAGNSGPGKNTMSPEAAAPWVIGVAAGTKEGGLASFSSRGIPRADRLSDSDPNNDFTAPTITSPGTGREFASDSSKFTSDIVSVRAVTNIVANGTTADTEIPTAFLPFYTQISGTSMATPHTAGVVALMLGVDPTLTPDDVKGILRQTASHMPGFSEFEVGAGYINAYAAIDKVLNRSKNYGTTGSPLDLQSFNEQFSVSGPPTLSWHIDYTPAALPGPGSANSMTFNVQSGMSVLDVLATFDTTAGQGTGNTIGILLTDPNGHKFSSGIALPILDSPSREVLVNNPAPGTWLLEVRGVRGLTTLPNVSLPTSGAAAPGPVDGTITQQQFTLAPVSDIQGDAAQTQIEFVLKNRMMDIFPDGTFRPSADETRGDFAQSLALNTPLRQSLGAAPAFTDVTGSMEAIAEAVTANGSNLRDWNFAPQGMMSANGSLFNPGGSISRLDMAVALVRALGLDAQAQALAGTNVTVTYNGQTLTLADNSNIPAALRGYVQLALNDQILQAFFSLQQGPLDFQPTITAQVKPNDPVTRAFLAFALANFRQHYALGN
jgi:serine protease AprX